MLSDIQIAQGAEIKRIDAVAAKLGIDADELDFYGKYKAKLSDELEQRVSGERDGKLILVTAVNPTPFGEGKTTTTVGLGQAMARLGKRSVIALREPSLGPVFGMKGGAAGGGYSQVIPMEDINLHLTGDFHAITSANNLLCAMIDNHIHQGNRLGIDPRRIAIKRCLDMNDRALRKIVIGLGGKANGVPREDSFNITVASEVMAIFCLSSSLDDLKNRLANILCGYTYGGEPVYAKDLNAQGAMAALLKEAIKPNLVQTLEGTPAIMHGGPFANIAHGCNSLRATRLGLKLADYCITEAGFGSDLGAEKFFDIKCRIGGLTPSAAVVVATVRALKYNGGISKDKVSEEDTDALKCGIANLGAHVENMKKFGIPVIVAINRFSTDTDAELDIIEKYCADLGVDFALSEVFAKGGEGGIDLAGKVISACEKESHFAPIYDTALSIEEKIETIAAKIYGADGVDFTQKARRDIEDINRLGGGELPVCVSKTQYSLSDDPKLLGRPQGFRITVSEVRLLSGAGFCVAMTGSILDMPGLPKKPAAEVIDVENGSITGLF